MRLLVLLLLSLLFLCSYYYIQLCAAFFALFPSIVATCTIEFVCFHVEFDVLYVLHISAVFCHILGWLMIPDRNGFYGYMRA